MDSITDKTNDKSWKSYRINVITISGEEFVGKSMADENTPFINQNGGLVIFGGKGVCAVIPMHQVRKLEMYSID